jgi:hypothetical protein
MAYHSELYPFGGLVPCLAELRSTNEPVELANEGPYWPTHTTHFLAVNFALQLADYLQFVQDTIFRNAAPFRI